MQICPFLCGCKDVSLTWVYEKFPGQVFCLGFPASVVTPIALLPSQSQTCAPPSWLGSLGYTNGSYVLCPGLSCLGLSCHHPFPGETEVDLQQVSCALFGASTHLVFLPSQTVGF